MLPHQTIPGPEEWTVIFNSDAGQWGSFTYDEKKDTLRVTAKPEAAPMQETLIYEAVESVKQAMEGILSPTLSEKIDGTIEIRQIFKSSKLCTVAII